MVWSIKNLDTQGRIQVWRHMFLATDYFQIDFTFQFRQQLLDQLRS